ncbi:hypothetical protein [Photobacterium sp. GSS17]|uniref:hypothetical protein n=1 Tax=Photobacterium sp. GSS17 TaxID=3020715 RepID=UPI00235EF99D|nr:hypothetical protein [Photobacterium sp. GSS17]
MKHSYKHVQASLLKFINQQAEAMGITALNLDAYPDIESLPAGDQLGLTGLGMTESDQIEEVTAMFVAITESDANNMRLSDRVSALYDACKAEEQIPLVHCETGEWLGRLVMARGATVFPVQRHAQTKAAQSVSFIAFVLIGTDSLSQESQ